MKVRDRENDGENEAFSQLFPLKNVAYRNNVIVRRDLRSKLEKRSEHTLPPAAMIKLEISFLQQQMTQKLDG